MERQTLFIIICILGIICYFLFRLFVKIYRNANAEKNNENKPHDDESLAFAKQHKYQFNQIIETDTIYQPAGSEERIIDNSKNNGVVKRKLIISREWKKTISIGSESSDKIRAKIGTPYNIIEGEIDKILKEKYETSIEETKYFSEEIELEIGAYTKMIMNINWKIIWQNGEIEIISANGEKLKMPFKIVKGLTFDQMQEKVN